MKYFVLSTSLFLFASCSSIQVFSDHDSSIDFSKYSTFAYFKPEIDQVKISDLDKRRILKAIDAEMSAKGLSKSETPDLLIGFTTQAKEQIYINNQNNWGWGWGFNPWFWGPSFNTVSTRTEGTLFVNIIDATTKQLVWQGKGRGGIQENYKNRDERIALFVKNIVSNYPPTE
ncbi:DUF4136 domain-containing protein [Flavobacteriaceae bacterium]|nr:DUF4136 domain-containing protein [Flavobacteriaceae bacterium]